MKILKKISGSIYSKLIALFVTVSIMPIIIIGINMNSNSIEQASEKAFDKLEAIGELKKDQVRNYMDERFENLYFLSKENVVIDGMLELNEKFPDSELNLSRFVNSSEYSEIVNSVDRYFLDYSNRYGINDIVLIDTNGNIIYSIKHYSDFATNIFTGQFKNSGLNKAICSAREKENITISDYELYPPANNKPSSFFVNVLWSPSGEFLGYLAIQLPITQINELMHKDYGLGTTGESYLVGVDHLMRTDLRKSDKETVLRKEILTESITNGLNGDQGVQVITGIDETEVLSYYSPVGLDKIYNCEFDWIIIVELNKEEAFAASIALFNKFSLLGITLTLIVFVLAFLISRSISKPIKKITNGANQIALGDLSYQIDVIKNDEIGELANSLRELQSDLGKKILHAQLN